MHELLYGSCQHSRDSSVQLECVVTAALLSLHIHFDLIVFTVPDVLTYAGHFNFEIFCGRILLYSSGVPVKVSDVTVCHVQARQELRRSPIK